MFSKRDWILLAIAFVFIVLGVWFDLTVPEYLGELTGLVTGTIPGTIGDVWMQGLWMLLFSLGSMVTAIIVAWIGAVVASSLGARIRKGVFEKVGDFSTAEMKKFSVASLITRSTNDVTQVQMFTVMAVQVLVRAPILAVWAILEILGRSWELSLVTFISVAVLASLLIILIILVLPKFNKIQGLTDKLNQVSRENLTGLRVVRAYNASDFEEQKFDCANTNLAKNNLFVNRFMGLFWPFMSLLLSGVGLAIWWVGSALMSSGAEGPEFLNEVMVFNQYSMQIIFAFMMMIMVLVMLPRSLVSGKRIMEVMNTKPSVVSGSSDSPRESLSSSFDIKFDNVAFKYPGAEESVLSDINITIPQGKTVAFIGGTGSGKSTLVNLLPRIYDATDGKILIGENCVRDITLESLSDIVGYIPQTATIFNGTIRSNIAFGKVSGQELNDDDIKSALKTAQAWEFVSKLEKGLDSEVSQSGKNLSGGQKQRLAIARVVARKPKIYIFDDTFSALDYRTDKKLRDALKKETTKTGASVLIVAQRIGTIKDADMIYVLDKGKVVGTGTHDQLMNSCEVYRETALSQLSKEELEGGK